MLGSWTQLAPTANALQGHRLLPTVLLPALETCFKAATALAGTSHRSHAQNLSTARQLHSGHPISSSSSSSSSDNTASSATSSSSQPYDVCIVGAGMVGAALAALLRANPLTASMRIALIDQQMPPMSLEQPEFPDLRVSTITPANMQLLRQAGAWQELQPHAPTFQHMQVWEFAGPGFITWQAADVGLSYMGCVVENRLLQAALLRAAVKGSSSSSGDGSVGDRGCLDLICPASMQGLHIPDLSTSSSSSSSHPSTLQALGQQQDNSSSSSSSSSKLAEVQLADGRALQSRLLVAADGSRSKLRDLAGFRTVGWSYNQRGLVATVATSEPNDTAWQRFLPTGPIALLPVRDGYSNIVWTVTPEMAGQLEGCSSSEFAAAVNDALQQHPGTAAAAGGSAAAAAAAAAGPAVTAQGVLQGLAGALGKAPGLVQMLAGPLSAVDAAAPEAGQTAYWRPPPLVTGWVGSSPKSFPLQLQHSGRYVAPRVALVGDAAHAIHPLAGQGVNLGLADAAALAEALAQARRVGSDIGDVGMLQSSYEVKQQRANVRMMTALELLWRGFRVEQGFAGAVRSTGLGILNNMGPLKNNIMKYAMGLPSVPGSS